jgi:MYXO-CTERM domain-containing protein
MTVPHSARASACDSNLMIVLDRSCSMRGTPAGQTASKWQSAKAAINALTTDFAGQLRFGLIMFPDESGDSCTQDGGIYVLTGAGNEQDVRDSIAATKPDGPCVTNIDTAIGQVSQDPAFAGSAAPDGRRSFVVLITDGKQSNSCGGNTNDPITVANLETLYSAGYPTYVVGFGGGVDPADLSDFALAGGMARPISPMYYQADDAEELQTALAAIAGEIVSGDPEFGGCAGTPCPDDRCFGQGEACMEGTCRVSLRDGGPEPDATGDGTDSDAGIGGAANDESGGCGCRAESTPSPGAPLSLILLTILLARRRRAVVRD